jgi:hypothetical protein
MNTMSLLGVWGYYKLGDLVFSCFLMRAFLLCSFTMFKLRQLTTLFAF